MADHEASKNLPQIDWEAFYAGYRKPDYVPGYEILQKLGAGAFGIVFKARKHSIGKDYAIKFLKVDDAGVRDAVLHELDTVRLFAQIDHPNLVSIEDMGHVNGIPFIVMGYAGEETLGRRLQAGRLPREEALRSFAQVCRGVHALHERMLVHFDLKPANIYLKGDTARVGDYGLSKLVTASRRSLSFGRGTTYYMAPEVLHRKGDHRSDIYSLGVLLYECLVGRVPFQGDTEWEILKKHETEAPAYPEDLAASDRAILEACLAKDPDHRVQGIPAILAMLQGERVALPQGAATVAPRAERTQHAPRPARWPSRQFLALSAVGLLCGWCMMTYTIRGAPSNTGVAVASQGGGELAGVEASALRVNSPRGRGQRRGAPLPPRHPEPGAELAEAPSPEALPSDPGVDEFRSSLDAAIAALERLRELDMRLPEVRKKAMSALGATLRNVDLKSFRGQDPWTEAVLRAVQAGIEHDEVRGQWRDVLRTLVAPDANERKPR